MFIRENNFKRNEDRGKVILKYFEIKNKNPEKVEWMLNNGRTETVWTNFTRT